MSTILMITAGISLILIILNSMISKNPELDREKPSPFECGFDPKSSARLPFSLRFYLIAVIFLIFDVEITLIMPIPIIFSSSNIFPLIFLTMVLIVILLVGLYHEWNQGALDWKK
uniref:NADH-ubiquinone oxidoreductase chain 3 n=1 Tax=Metisotoma macnamarai TaxID=2682814 RepID=A0A650DQ14_9HEXA|nr:NADH dehydrogenase subunit 3 [Metisotoma macnamarai]